ncbi:Nephrocystin-3 [Trichoplax sp. H2]|nr:Nephrocystin-3 [Trichoplax sp. H2]|eukprot:RDD42751.1 Nephrocystin-3 [Trichoplax sp. H2]
MNQMHQERQKDLPWIISLPPKVSFFTGRRDLIQRIDEQLHSPDVINQGMAALVGIGGVGKSCLALHYAHSNIQQYNIVAWLNAENEISLQNDMVKLGQRIVDSMSDGSHRIPPTLHTLQTLMEQYQKTPAIRHDLTSDSLKRQSRDTQLLERIIEVSKDALDQQLIGPWLLIYDNVHRVKMVNKYIPTMRTGHIILTSRHRSWDDMIEIDIFNRKTSIEFLHRVVEPHGHSHQPIENDDAWDNIADILGDLPLALAQAAQYIRRKKISITTYVDQFKSLYQNLWQQEAPSSSYKQYLSENDDQCVVVEHTVETTWQIAISQVSCINPTACDLSTIAAYLSPNNISRELLVQLGVRILHVTENDVEIALDLLHDYCLMSWNGNCYNIHRLLQLVIRHKYQDSGVDQVVVEKLFQYYSERLYYDRRNIQQTLANIALIEHFEMARNYLNVYTLHDGKEDNYRHRQLVNSVILNVSHIYYNLANMVRAKDYVDEVLTSIPSSTTEKFINEGIHENQRHQFSRAIKLKGKIIMEMNDYDSALNNFHQALELERQHQNTLQEDIGKTLQLIGQANCRIGKFDISRQYLQQAIELQRQHLGENHLDVAKTYLWLGRVASKTGNLTEALTHANKALKIKKQLLGESNLDVAMIYETISNICRENYKYDDALRYFQNAIEFYKLHLGENALKVADGLHSLGRIYRQVKDLDQAMSCDVNALNIKQKQLGHEHVSLAYTYDELGLVYMAKNDYDNAKDNLMKSLQIKIKQLGEQHMNVAYTLDKIGLLYKANENYSQAMESFNQSLEIKKKQLGENHASAAYTYHQIGIIYKEKDDYINSLKYLQCALKIKRDSFGDDHVQTSYTLHEIGLLYKKFGDSDEAIRYLQRAHDTKVKQLGQDHIRALDSMAEINAIRDQIKKVKITIV